MDGLFRPFFAATFREALALYMGHRPDISPVWLIFAAAQRRVHRKMAVFRDFGGEPSDRKKRPAGQAGRF